MPDFELTSKLIKVCIELALVLYEIFSEFNALNYRICNAHANELK